jgi:hypothetical protein
MQVSYTIDKERRLIITTASGQLTMADVSELKSKLLNDPDFDLSYAHLVDMRALNSTSITGEEIRSLAPDQTTIKMRQAVVVSTDLLYGLGRMLENLREAAGGFGTRIFRDYDEAVDWLLSKRANQ